MAIDIGKAYVQIVPSAQGISGSISKVLNGESISAGKSAGNNIAGNIVSTLKKLIPAAAIGKLIYDSLNAGADLQQSIGGIETLFGAGGLSVEKYAERVGKSVNDIQDEYDDLIASQERMFEAANRAYATTGLSANEYMQNVTSFAASLKQSVGGDLEELTKVADMAMVDMADNSNKMGTSMESIQNAYQGFAKQNYTMLDNLKLGYGGTKGEMERLLKDAQKVTGIKYDIKNLADVYSAIHVIQGELGITGTTAEEAAKTFSGSFNAMKAAASNVIANLMLGEDLTPHLQALTDTAGTFLFDNLIPAVINVVSALPGALYQTVVSFYPQFSQHASELIATFCTFLREQFPQLLQNGLDMLQSITEGFRNGFPGMASAAMDLIIDLAKDIWDNMPQILEIGVNIIDGLVKGVLSAAGRLLEAVGNVVMGAFNKAKEWLGIASPSKKFAYLGEMTGEGLALGLSQSAGDVKKAVDGLLDPLNVPGLNGSMSVSSAQPYGRALVINFSIDNSGKDITDQDVRRWCGLIDEALGGAV